MICVCDTPFDPGHELKAFENKADAAGAIVSFLGRVRPEANDDPVKALHLEHFPGVTQKSIEAFAVQACQRWPITQHLIIHRVGMLAPGEPIVFVCVGAAHRREAFEAADFLMDYLKTKAIFWKKEIRDSGARWVEPRGQDHVDTQRWSSK